MSWQATTAVIKQSKAKGSDLLLMLMIANYAGPDGSGAFPSNKALCRDSKMCERGVRYILKRLAASGELIINEGAGPKGCNVYKIVLGQSVKPVSPQNPPDSHGGQSLQGQSLQGGGASKRSKGGQGVAPKQLLVEEQSLNLKPSESDDSADVRHAEIRKVIITDHAKANRMREELVPWDGREGAALAKLLKSKPKLTVDDAKRCCRNYYLTECHNISRKPAVWIPKMLEFWDDALDKFKKPKYIEQRDEQQKNAAKYVGMHRN